MRTIVAPLLSWFTLLAGPVALHAEAEAPPTTTLAAAAVWKFQTPGPVNAAPLVTDGVLYCGSTGGGFFAINATSGQLVWKFTDMKFPITSRAAIAGDSVYFESGNTLFALDRRTGAERWHFVAKPFRPIASMDFTDYHRSAPVVADALVWFGDDWGNINGLDLATGGLKFQYTTATGRPIRATVAVHGGTVYFGDWEGTVYAVSIADKRLRWQHTLEDTRPYYGAVVSEFVVSDGLVYFGSQHDIFTPLAADTGEPAWKFADGNHTYLPSTPLLVGSRVIIGSTIRTNAVFCLERGEPKWTFKADGIFFTKPVLIGELIGINSTKFGGTGHLYFLEAATGKLAKELTIPKASPSSPAIADGKLYLGSGDGYIYAVDLKTVLPN